MLVCPRCRKSEIDLSAPGCPECQWRGDLLQGIPRLLPELDSHRTTTTNHAYEEHYEGLAKSDLSQPIIGLDYVGYQAQRLVRYMGNIKGMAVCDIGCGRGTLSTLLAQRGAHVTAVDLSLTYLKHLSTDTNIRVICCDADNLPFEEEFDAVVSTDVMEHTLRPGGFLFSLNHSLKPGGLAYIRVPYRENLISYAPQLGCPHPLVHLRSYNRSLLRDIFAGAGFKVEGFHLDGFSLGTPRDRFTRANTRLAHWYLTFANWIRPRLRSEAEIALWPSWFAQILMRPLEIVVRARKTMVIEPAPGGTVYRLAPCAT
jgi:2-polyprenyl-3-methyl-5-hydroxy-6-metoxy-1,4-benzoquinol methylase